MLEISDIDVDYIFFCEGNNTIEDLLHAEKGLVLEVQMMMANAFS